MNRRTLLIALLVASAAALLLAIGAARLGAAHARLAAADARLAAVAQQTAELARLRDAQPLAAWGEPDYAELLALRDRAIDAAGVPLRSLRSSEFDRSGTTRSNRPGQDPLRTATATFRLESLSPPQIGRFLDELFATAQLWKPARLELSHTTEPDSAGLFDLTLVVTARYISQQADE